jgi:translation elongation factor EF-G
LEIICDRLERDFNIKVVTGKAYVAYRETLLNEKVIKHRQLYDRLIGTKQLYAEISMSITSMGNSADPVITVSEEAQAKLSAEEKEALMMSLQSSVNRGPEGYPIAGVSISIDNLKRNNDTTPGSLQACAAIGLDKVMRSSHHALLEPVMSLEVEVSLVSRDVLCLYTVIILFLLEWCIRQL